MPTLWPKPDNEVVMMKIDDAHFHTIAINGNSRDDDDVVMVQDDENGDPMSVYVFEKIAKQQRHKFLSASKSCPKRKSKRVKRVHFAPLPLFHSGNDENIPPPLDDDKSQLWWSSSELEFIRKRSHALSNEIATTAHKKFRSPMPYCKLLEQVYENCARNRNVCPHDLRGLCVWTALGHSRRGLERWSVPSIGSHVTYRRQMLAHHLLKAQYEMGVQETQREAILRKVSECYSKPARNFAIVLGQADQAAARQVHAAAVVEK